MPGFILDMRGLYILFKIPARGIDAANRRSYRSIETMLPVLRGENKSPGRVMGAINIGDNCLPCSLVHSVTPFCKAHEWRSFDSGSRIERRCCLF